ncbi:MAG: hypothetical protein QOE86_4235, partial [Solirubrobacteraceae bacterium]|nr:hypothetical protein [Solirubrobacteraceae bacterium]
MLIGREAELAAAGRALDRLAARGPSALLLVGEAGIGKSSLLADAAARAGRGGIRVAAARAAEFERDVPFALLTALLDEALADPPPRLAAPPVDALVERPRHRLNRELRLLLEALAAGRRVLLAIDDLHWSDAASLEALLALVHRPPRGAVCLLLAARPGTAALRLTEALRSRPDAERVDVGPLAAGDAARLVGPSLSRRERTGVLAAAGGNPFYLQELSRTARSAPAEHGESSAGGAIPAAIMAAVAAEVAALGRAARALLHGAAVAGDPFDPDLAVAACGKPLGDAVDDLLAADLVRPDGRPRQLRFRHPIVRAAVLEAAGEAFRVAA